MWWTQHWHWLVLEDTNALTQHQEFLNLFGLCAHLPHALSFLLFFSLPVSLSAMLLRVTLFGSVSSLIACSFLWHPCGSPIRGCLLLLMCTAHLRTWWAVITTAALKPLMKPSNHFPLVLKCYFFVLSVLFKILLVKLFLDLSCMISVLMTRSCIQLSSTK